MITQNIRAPKPRQSPCRHSIPQAPASRQPTIPPVDARFRKHLSKKHISGIAASSKSKPAIPDVDARFRKHPLKKHTSSSRSKPASSYVDARFCKLKTPHQWHRSEHQIKTSHSPCRCSITQAPTRDTSGITTFPISRKDRAQHWIAQELQTGWETTYDRGIEN